MNAEHKQDFPLNTRYTRALIGPFQNIPDISAFVSLILAFTHQNLQPRHPYHPQMVGKFRLFRTSKMRFFIHEALINTSSFNIMYQCTLRFTYIYHPLPSMIVPNHPGRQILSGFPLWSPRLCHRHVVAMVPHGSTFPMEIKPSRGRFPPTIGN